ncbi:hypothetical protein L6164_025266 [Bauhinia variegata]|uniref:Uncharacterized protein n=1 Tax=Bauhinia variegata TaxID=167791 RepID=A0ACB9M1E6_BAUVA|nr:hypothetical protein L6164_025266 [Bauhinia variegata]
MWLPSSIQILKHLMENNVEYCMEVIPNYSFDLKSAPSMVKLLKISRDPDKRLRDDFKLIDTASTWVNLRAIKRLVNTGRLTNEILSISKVLFLPIVGHSGKLKKIYYSQDI